MLWPLPSRSINVLTVCDEMSSPSSNNVELKTIVSKFSIGKASGDLFVFSVMFVHVNG